MKLNLMAIICLQEYTCIELKLVRGRMCEDGAAPLMLFIMNLIVEVLNW